MRAKIRITNEEIVVRHAYSPMRGEDVGGCLETILLLRWVFGRLFRTETTSIVVDRARQTLRVTRRRLFGSNTAVEYARGSIHSVVIFRKEGDSGKLISRIDVAVNPRDRNHDPIPLFVHERASRVEHAAQEIARALAVELSERTQRFSRGFAVG